MVHNHTDKKARRFPADRFSIIGWLLIAAGILLNPWLLQLVLSPDGHFKSNFIKIIIIVFDLLIIAMGLPFLRWERKRLGKALLKGAFWIFVIILSVCLAEFLLRIHESYATQKSRVPMNRKNPHGTGSYRVKPRFKASFPVDDAVVTIKTNSEGMHWREFDRDKLKDKPVIAFLGDSFTFGLFVSEISDTFVGIFDAEIGKKYHVLNFGVPGYGLADMELYLTEEILSLRPAMVFLMFYNGNDLLDTYLGVDKYVIEDGLAKRNESLLASKVPCEYLPKKCPAPETPGYGLVGRHINNIIYYSKIFRRSSELLFRYEDSLREREKGLESLFRIRNALYPPFWSRKQYPAFGREAVLEMQTVLGRIHELCSRHQVRLVLVSIPFREQIEVDRPMSDGYDIRRPQLFVEAFARDHGLDYLDLLPDFREAYRRNRTDFFWKNDTHFNLKGHRLTGECLIRFFEKEIEKPQGSEVFHSAD